jgi:hypothetical protein
MESPKGASRIVGRTRMIPANRAQVKAASKQQGNVHPPARMGADAGIWRMAMFALGCLFLIVLPLMGLFIGGAIAGLHGATWGAVIGLVIAVVTCVLPAYALVKASRRSRD